MVSSSTSDVIIVWFFNYIEGIVWYSYAAEGTVWSSNATECIVWSSIAAEGIVDLYGPVRFVFKAAMLSWQYEDQ